jgi:hypothetical protein
VSCDDYGGRVVFLEKGEHRREDLRGRPEIIT